jgi:hypothetical protein
MTVIMRTIAKKKRDDIGAEKTAAYALLPDLNKYNEC